MAMRKETDFNGLFCGYEEGNRLSRVSIVAIRIQLTERGLYCGYEESN